MNWLVAALAVCALVPSAHSASQAIDWCYHLPSCNDSTWPVIAPQFCNGSRQSPINIVSASAISDSSLTGFTFHNFSRAGNLKLIQNTGKTAKVTIGEYVGFTGGNFPQRYNSLQFHLHWGNGSSIPGSEHTLNGKRYAMELHIVNMKGTHGGNTTAGLSDPTGFAALGFFIEAFSDDSIGQPPSWDKLSSYLPSIQNSSTNVTLDAGMTLSDLLVGVNFSSYYRYHGSLTTPNCNEAVVWTVFKDTIKVSKNVINRFSTTLHVGNTPSSPLAVNTFRRIQPAQVVSTQPSDQASSSTGKTCYSLGVMALSLVLGRGWSQ